MNLSAVSSALAAIAALIGVYFAFRTVKASTDAARSAQLAVYTMSEVAGGNTPHVNYVLLVTNRGPATARSVRVEVRYADRDGEVMHIDRREYDERGADGSAIVTVSALAPGGSVRRLLFINVGDQALRFLATATWTDDTSDSRRDVFELQPL